MNLQMELTNHCNLKCIECPNRFMKRKRTHMTRAVFDVVKEEYIEHLDFETIILHKDGESLLHPLFQEFVESISEVSSAKLDLYTNGLFLDKTIIDFLGSLKNKICILISFHFENADGSTINYDVKHISSLIAGAKKNIDFVIVTHLIREKDRRKLRKWKEQWEMFSVIHRNLSAVHINESINPWCGRIKVGNLASFPTCPYADGVHFFIGSTGNVLPCCMDLDEELVLGNIMTDSRESILAKRDAFYNESEWRETDLCRRCLDV